MHSGHHSFHLFDLPHLFMYSWYFIYQLTEQIMFIFVASAWYNEGMDMFDARLTEWYVYNVRDKSQCWLFLVLKSCFL